MTMNEKKPLSGVVFDLDHTLFDRYGTYRLLAPLFHILLGKNVLTDVDTFCEAICDADRHRHYYGWDAIRRELVEKNVFSSGLTTAEFVEIMRNTFSCGAVELPFAAACLSGLKDKGLKLGLMTNGEKTLQNAKLSHLDLSRFFDEIVTCEKGEKLKPYRKPFDDIAHSLNIPNERLMYVGDNPINDVFGAKNAGYFAVWVKTVDMWVDYPDHPPVTPDFAIDDISALNAVIDENFTVIKE